VKRFYEDKEFAIQAYMHYDQSIDHSTADKLYALYAGPQVFERVPYVLASAVEGTIARQPDIQFAKQMKAIDLHAVIDNAIIDQLVADKYFERLFGAEVLNEQTSRKAAAFGRR
jgi:hypothetical protein